MTEGSRAVFLSYASADAAAAERIATGLRSAGIEVWFDRSELRGGDAWDRRIREQIYGCRLFVAVISASTEARDEGYFRREWKTAVDRTHDMAETKAFLVPVVIDGTPERGASVPDKFRELQWSRLAGGEPTAAFVERVQRLLSLGAAGVPQRQSAPPIPAAAGGVSAPPGSRPAAQRWRLLAIGLAAAAVLTIGLLALGRHSTTGPAASAVPADRSAPPVAAAAPTSIAVLPFTNESGDPSQQYFSDGLSEDLITALAQFPGLKVIGRTSSFRFRNSTDDSRTIGAKLGVTHLLEGSVRRAGDTVRVSAELINSSDGSALWSERYDRPYQNLFALQDEVTRAVAGTLHSRLVHGDTLDAQSERPPSGNLDAYSALLQGKFAFARNTEADQRKAIERFTTATQLDPRYALAWSLLSQAWTLLASEFLGGTALQEAAVKARGAADTALALAPQLAEAHLARGTQLQYVDLDWRGSGSEFQRALELAPNSGAAKFYLGGHLASVGRLDQGIDLVRQALTLDPLRAPWHSWLSLYLLGAGQLDEGEKAAHRAIELQGGGDLERTILVMIAIRRGDSQLALDAAQQVSPGLWRDVAVAMATQVASDRAAADAALKTLIAWHAGGAAYQVAEVYAIRNDPANVFAWLDRAWSNRDPGISLLLYDPFIVRYKKDPRFAAFCRKVALPVP